MKKGVILLFILTMLCARMHAGNSESRIWDVKVHNVNDVEMCVSNFGKIGQDASGDVGCWWPTGSGQNYICGAGIWFGVRDSVASDSIDTLVTVGYLPFFGQSEFAPGLSGQDPDDDDVIVYLYPNDWPPPSYTFPMAPQHVLSHQDSWCCYNDSDVTYHTPDDTRPIGIEIYQTIYAWCDTLVEDLIFITCEVKNVSEDTLHDCYIGFCADCDIGSEMGTSGNDRYAGIVGRWYVVNGESLWVDDCAFQWQEFEEPGWASYPGVIGCDLVQTPPDLVQGCDKDGDGILDQYECDSAYYVNNLPIYMWDVDNDSVPDWRDPSEWPQYGMNTMKRFTVDTEPTLDGGRYRLLAGYDSYGYFPFDTLTSGPGDQRFLQASGPFDLGPDSSATIICAVMFADLYGIFNVPDTAVAIIDQFAQLWYDMYWFRYFPGVEEHAADERIMAISIIPNPMKGRAQLQFNMARPGHVTATVYDAAGRLIRHVADEDLTIGQHTINIESDGLSSGTYFVVLETGSHNTTRAFVVVK